MSQPSLLQAQSSSPTSRPASTKSEKKNLSKTLKHAFSRRKRSGSLRVGNDELDLDGISQRSGSIGPESFLSNEHSIAEEPRMSEDVTIEQRYIPHSLCTVSILLHVHPLSLRRVDDLTLFPFKSTQGTLTLTTYHNTAINNLPFSTKHRILSNSSSRYSYRPILTSPQFHRYISHFRPTSRLSEGAEAKSLASDFPCCTSHVRHPCHTHKPAFSAEYPRQNIKRDSITSAVLVTDQYFVDAKYPE